ncbi:DUF1795 domain-containing protein [Candidatus Parcubacteria bacterium]|nr:MAG: DUF1795 domain-containing protein [Candidatus Parcubacteria bacterium]
MEMMNFEGPGFTLQVPSNWFITSTPQIQAMFVAPPRKGGRANFMVTLRPVEKDVTLDQVVQTSLDTMQKEYAQFELLQAGEYQKGDLIGHQRLYTWFSKEHNAPILQRQVIFIADQILYTLTTTRVNISSLEDLDAVFEQMIASFQFVEGS